LHGLTNPKFKKVGTSLYHRISETIDQVSH